ncbi:(2Fe-2S)-binding protein [Luteimonas saliphila]|uniref:(2Fe-2S)-binding protein n=1 Tax=Luteimonas saliphila TaxID=2804919 RepID=UPI00192D8699|nr:(2Fe-2S)-binding protein [Luteimonas saliphila]
MYVCICNGVTELDIRRAAEAGCGSLPELTMRTGVGACCGTCVETASALLEQSRPITAACGLVALPVLSRAA